MNTNLSVRMEEALGARFVKCAEIARIIALAIESGKNMLLWGPGGHGKSEMVQLALALVAAEDNIFVQSFGEGMDEATLWGGLDFAALEKEKVLRYFPDQSFLAKPYAVFEEIFDAPASVLLALKDTLTARKLRKGSQVFTMKTKVIIAITNRDPKELIEMGPAAAALIERFPLQLNVKWPSYTARDYLELFSKVEPFLAGANLNGTKGVLAEVMGKASEDGEPVSPRTAVHALGIVKAAAGMRGSAVVERNDLLDLCFLPGMEQFAVNLKQELDAAFERAAAESRMMAAEAKLRELLGEFDEARRASSPIKLLQVAKRFVAFADEVASLKVTDSFTDRRKKMRDSINEKATEAQRFALENTRA
jgi:energy-coupling factor transporter ATP-binding protein EcfA2